MSKVILGMTLSLDGFIHDENGSVARLYPDMAAMAETQELQDAIKRTGAVIMGRHSYDMAQGDYTGYEFQVPIFVVTHEPPETTAKGENDKLSFTFVTDGVESAIKQAKAAAGNKDVTVVGGASIAQQLLNLGLVDELDLDIRPIFLGQGLRLFENITNTSIQIEPIKVYESNGQTHLRFRVIK